MPDDDTTFGANTHMKLMIKPHDFEFEVSGEVLRRSDCCGYTMVVSRKGEVCFYDTDFNLLAKAEESHCEYKEVAFKWSQNCLSLSFGQRQTVDYYPNCDGEYDRWGTEWVSQRTVTLNLKNNSIEVA